MATERRDPPAATNHRTKNEPDGSVTTWESHDGGKTWWMTGQTYPKASDAATPPDAEGLRRARELAQWKLGYRAWADAILEAYFNPGSAAWKEAHKGIHGTE